MDLLLVSPHTVEFYTGKQQWQHNNIFYRNWSNIYVYNMSEVKKIKDDELAEIKMLQKKYQDITFQLGQLQIEKLELDTRLNNVMEIDKKLKEEYQNVKKMEQEAFDKILKNYGEIKLNVSDGSFE
jgi:hypothetical protein